MEDDKENKNPDENQAAQEKSPEVSFQQSGTAILITSKVELDWAFENEEVLMAPPEKGVCSLRANPAVKTFVLGMIQENGFNAVDGLLLRINLPKQKENKDAPIQSPAPIQPQS